MEVEVYDRYFRRTKILDSFTSLIWNDVYCGYGDFEIEYPMDENALAYIDEGYYLEIESSDKIMIVEKIEIVTSFQNGNVCRLSGRSLESILDRRVVREKYASNKTDIQSVISTLLNQNIINASDPNRNVEGFAMKWSNDPKITGIRVTTEVSIGDNLYTTIQKLCQEKNIGFRIGLHDERFFQFELYSGEDHSYDQTSNPWVVFSTQFENLEESDMAIDLTKHKNSMMIDFTTTQDVVDPINGSSDTKVIIPIVIGADISGLDRREIYGSSNQEVDKINKSTFGTAAARVNSMDYSSWVPVYFDKDAYDKAMDAYNKRLNSSLKDASKRKTVTVTKVKDPPTVPWDDPTATWLNYYDEVTYEPVEDAAARRAAIISQYEKSRPNEEDYMSYGWAITDWNGYNAAIAKAQADIDAEFAATQAAALDYAKAKVLQWASEELAEYREITSFDGKLDEKVNFIYRRDYFLGDIVQVVNPYHFNAKTRVTSILICQDNSNGIIVRPQFESDNIAEVEFDLSDTTDF